MLIINLYLRYDEVCDPKFSFSKLNDPDSRAFTQLVWRDSSVLGIGKATTKNKNDTCTFIVALYKPPGIIMLFFVTSPSPLLLFSGNTHVVLNLLVV